MEAILEIQNLTKKYEAQTALNQLTLSVKKGEILGLLGPNGAGKTTLISILSGLILPTSGNAFIYGLNLLQEPLETKKKIGLVPQEMINHGYFTVEQVLKFHLGYYGLPHNPERIDYLLQRLALHAHRNKQVSQLSGGMKRRLLIAKALIHSPPLLFLDEPTAGVDVELRNTLWDFVRELNQEGVTVLLTTHYLQEAEALCDRIAVLNQGELIALDPTQKMIQKMTQRHLKISLDSSEPWSQMPQEIHIKDAVIHQEMARDESVGERLLKMKLPLERVRDISIVEGTLEEAFIELLNQKSPPVVEQIKGESL